MEISLIHPSRSRPQKSFDTINIWMTRCVQTVNVELILSLDLDDPSLEEYKSIYTALKWPKRIIERENKNAVTAINEAAKISTGRILMVVSDDTMCPAAWDTRIMKYTEGKKDFVLKVRDGIQPIIVTAPILDRAYFQRDGFIYHPKFSHAFADRLFTDLAHNRKRVITKNILFKHDHYSIRKNKIRDAQYERTDATFNEGRQIYKELKKEYGL